MQRIGNLVDLEKRCKMSIWLQNFALIQPRTSPLKFDHLAEKSEKDSVSNLAPKVYSARGGPAVLRGEARDDPRRGLLAMARGPTGPASQPRRDRVPGAGQDLGAHEPPLAGVPRGRRGQSLSTSK